MCEPQNPGTNGQRGRTRAKGMDGKRCHSKGTEEREQLECPELRFQRTTVKRMCEENMSKVSKFCSREAEA